MNGGRGIEKECLLVFFVNGARTAIVSVLTVIETQNLEPDRTILSFTSKPLINFRNLSHPVQLNRPQDDQSTTTLRSPLVPHPLISLLHCARVYLTDCCVCFTGRRPSKAMMYFTFNCFLVVQFAIRNEETTPPQTFRPSRFSFPTSPQLMLMPTIG